MRLIHTSDLHLLAGRPFAEDLAMVRAVASAAATAAADALVVAGDLFEHNRVATDVAERLVAELAGGAIPVVVLPGNHDPLTEDSVLGRVAAVEGLFVIGVHGPTFVAPAHSFAITGRPHLDYADFRPLSPPLTALDGPAAGVTETLVVLAHGHFDGIPDDDARYHPGWLITSANLDAQPAVYVGLGHWDRAFTVREADPPTYYSGSPWLAGTVNLVVTDGDGDGRQPAVSRIVVEPCAG